jgi:hypothetical protein
MNSQNLEDLSMEDLYPVAAVTADGLGSAIDVRPYEGDLILVIDISAPVAGTNPTMDAALHSSATTGGSYTAVTGTSITQVTTVAAATKILVPRGSCLGFVKLNLDIGGTMSPQYLVSAKLYGMKKYL